ncbi:MAG: serine/threonine-protein kinase [Verrucomicrobiota bacterium]
MDSRTEMNQPIRIAPESKSKLKMVPCGKCGASVFIAGDIPRFQTTPCTKCGHPVMLPVRLRQFELRSIVASGGMGTVFRAFDTSLDRMVAVKLMKPELSSDEALVKSFSREARACARLNHTNIIHIYAFDDIEGEKYIVMELCDCGSLDDKLTADGKVDELHILDVGIKISYGLIAAMKHNLLHLDIKPANILYNDEGEPKLVDFGLASKSDEEFTADEGGVMGTPDYIAPERVQQTGQDFRSDMYSLAATMYHCLTGRVPFEADGIEATAFAHITEPLIPPLDLNPELSEQTSNAICMAMAKRPEDRFQSYDEFIMSLEASRSYLLVQRFRPGR